MEYGPIRNLNGFNRDFADWIGRYYEDGKNSVNDWNDALEVLNTVGASALAGRFKLEDR